MNLYLQVLAEAAHSASVIPFSSEATLAAMQSFGGYNLKLAATLALIGSCAGQTFNWLVGIMLLKMQQRAPAHNPINRHYPQLCAQFKKLGWVMIPLCWLPLMNLMIVAAGFFKFPYRYALPLIALGEAYHYGSFLF